MLAISQPDGAYGATNCVDELRAGRFLLGGALRLWSLKPKDNPMANLSNNADSRIRRSVRGGGGPSDGFGGLSEPRHPESSQPDDMLVPSQFSRAYPNTNIEAVFDQARAEIVGGDYGVMESSRTINIMETAANVVRRVIENRASQKKVPGEGFIRGPNGHYFHDLGQSDYARLTESNRIPYSGAIARSSSLRDGADDEQGDFPKPDPEALPVDPPLPPVPGPVVDEEYPPPPHFPPRPPGRLGGERPRPTVFPPMPPRPWPIQSWKPWNWKRRYLEEYPPDRINDETGGPNVLVPLEKVNGLVLPINLKICDEVFVDKMRADFELVFTKYNTRIWQAGSSRLQPSKGRYAPIFTSFAVIRRS